MSQGTELHTYYSGVGTSTSATSTLPMQTLTDTSKNKDDWKKRNLDALESIGISQLAQNIHFRDFYKMLEGRLTYSDYGIEDASILNRIKDLGDGVGVPTFVKHYDIIGIMTRQIVGEWLKQKDNFKVDSVDEISESDYLRERTRRVQEFATETFKKELEIQLLRMGINPTETEFTSEEEQQQYIQMLEQEKAKIISPDIIEKELSKNFKTKAAEWAEHVIEADQVRFHLDKLDGKEMEDYLLTGRFFRHYYVGYDYYKPERWSPIETFFSQDMDAEYPQDGEYVGRIYYISPSDIMKRYGHLMTAKEIKILQRRYGEATGNSPLGSMGESFRSNMTQGMFGQTQTVPFHNFYDYDLGLQFQDALDIPMGEIEIDTPNGSQKVPTWLSPFQNNGYLGYGYSKMRRDDIQVKSDLLQVTEAYWRSWKKMWFLNYTTKEGYNATEIVTDELLPEFIKEYGITKSSTKSLTDLQKEPLSPNTMYEFWIPEAWKGIKINAGNSFLSENLYLDIKPLEYQIKGDSNVFDVKLPVAGVIGNSLAQRVRPYQIGYNICLNQIFNLLEKEIGMFFLFDINFLPSEYKDHGTIEDSLEKLRDLAKDIGLVPLDTTKQNMAGANPQMNTFMVQDVTFDKQINSRIQLSEYYFKKALEQVGITDQRRGQATTYETATGVQQGVEASYDQTSDTFTTMSIGRRKAMELHLAVAQYCQKEYIDVDFVFKGADGDRHYLNLTDPDFPLRRLGLMSQDSASGRRNLETVRNTLLQMNTLGATIANVAEAYNADTILELVNIGKRQDLEKEKQVQAQREHEQQLLDKQLEAQANEKEAERQFKASQAEKDRETKIEIESISAYGRASDKKSDSQGFEEIRKATQDALNNDFKSKELSIKQDLANTKQETDKAKLDRIDEELKLKVKELELKKEQLATMRYTSTINKN